MYVRLYDPALRPEEQGSRHDVFKVEWLLNLAEMSNELELKTLLRALVHPVNAPRVPEMCPYILKASHDMDL